MQIEQLAWALSSKKILLIVSLPTYLMLTPCQLMFITTSKFYLALVSLLHALISARTSITLLGRLLLTSMSPLAIYSPHLLLMPCHPSSPPRLISLFSLAGWLTTIYLTRSLFPMPSPSLTLMTSLLTVPKARFGVKWIWWIPFSRCVFCQNMSNLQWPSLLLAFGNGLLCQWDAITPQLHTNGTSLWLLKTTLGCIPGRYHDLVTIPWRIQGEHRGCSRRTLECMSLLFYEEI